MVSVARAFIFTLALVVFFAIAYGVELRLTSPLHRVVKPGEIVTHVFRVEGEGGPYPVEVSSSAGFYILSQIKAVNPPRYLPVTIRVPEDALEGTVDVLTVRVGDAVAEARTEVTYVPGLELEGPSKLAFVPPAILATFTVYNSGNGQDEALLKFFKEGELVSTRRIALKPREAREVQFRITSPGSCRLEARLVRGKVKRSWSLYVKRAQDLGMGEHRVWGAAALSTSSQGGYSAQLGLGGRLSDYVGMQFSVGWSDSSLPMAKLRLRGDNWRASLFWAGSFSLGASYRVGPAEFSVSYHDLGNFGFGAAYGAKGQHHRFWFSWSGAPMYYLSGRASLGFGVKGIYRLDYSPVEDSGSAHFELTRGGWSTWVELDTSSRVEAGIDVRTRSLDAGVGAAWQDGEMDNWYAAALWNPRRKFEGWRPVAAAWVNSERYGLALGVSDGKTRLAASASRAWEGEWSYSGSLSHDLPAPWTSFSARYSYGDGESRWGAAVGLQGEWEGTRLGSKAWVSSSWEESGLSLEVETGGDIWSLGGKLEAYPWDARGRGESWVDFYIAGLLVGLSVYKDFPDGDWGWRVGAVRPLSLAVPRPVVELFGGRKVAYVRGRLVHDGPPMDLSGIRVVAGDNYEAITDAKGRFELELPPGEYLIAVDPTTLPVVLALKDKGIRLRVKAKQTYEIELRLEARSAIKGQVKAKGKPPRSLAVWIWIENEAGRKAYVRADRLGRFSAGGLKPGRYKVGVLENSLPWGYKTEPRNVKVDLGPGEIKEVELWVVPVPKKVFTTKPVIIMSVRVESQLLPPGARPLVEAEVEGEPDKLLVLKDSEVLGELRRADEKLWRGRFKVPEIEGKHLLRLVAYVGGQAVSDYIFVVEVSKKARWGVVRTRPVVPKGAKGVPVHVHLYAPAREVWLLIEGKRYELEGAEADWRGRYDAPSEPGRYRMKVIAVLEEGMRIEIARGILVK